MTFFSPFKPMGIFFSGEMGNSLFSKDVYTSPIYLDPHPTQSVLPFALASSPLTNLSAGSTIEKNTITIASDRKYQLCILVAFAWLPALQNYPKLLTFMLSKRLKTIMP